MTKALFGRGQTPKLPLRWCLGGVSKSRPRAYQARALPLSYPGIYAAVYIYEKLSAKTSPNLIRIMVPIAGLEPARSMRNRFSYYSMSPWPLARCSLDYVFSISCDLGGWYIVSTHLGYLPLSTAFSDYSPF